MPRPHAYQGTGKVSTSTDDAVEIRAESWRALASLHGLVDTALEGALQAVPDPSVVEFTVLDALSRQDDWPMRM